MAIQNRDRMFGAGLVLLSAVAWSLNGLYTRILTVDVWTTLAGRAISTSSMLLVAMLLIRGRETPRVLIENAKRGGLVVVANWVAMIAFVTALFHTSVANVTVIYSISPLLAAVLAYFLIGDRVAGRTMVAFGSALAGVAIMVNASFGTDRLFGDFLALVMSVSFAFVMVEMRRKPEIDNLTTSFLTSLLTVIVIGPFATFSAVTPLDALVLFLFGFTSNILGTFAFIAGVRRIPPAEAGVIATVEILLAPFWVWLAFSENPGRATIVGGAIVLGAIIFHLSRGGRRRQPEGGEAVPPG